jgi:Tol biopolymer transport system component
LECIAKTIWNNLGGMMVSKQRTITLLVLVLSLLESSCGPGQLFDQTITPNPTLTSTPIPTSTFTPTLTPRPTVTPTITPTPIGSGLGKIAFVSERDGNPEVYVMNSDGSEQTRLTNNPYSDNYPNWSPDGKKIIYRSERIDRVEVFVVNLDGTAETNLTQNPQYFDVEEPKWSLDGNKIAYVGCPPYKPSEACEIFTMNADGGEKKQVTNNDYDDRYFEWSPDNKQIAYWSFRNTQGDVYVINVDGSSELKLTNNPKYPNHISYNIDPSWSLDGKTILYMSTNFNTPHYEIYAVNSDGSDETRITRTKSSEWIVNGQQMWSPDGRKITFTYWDEKGEQVIDRICIMNSDGSERIFITDGPSDNEPRWSPDGKKIAFVSQRDGQPEIYIMNIDGSNQTRITYSSVDESWLWQFQWAP